jgi:uncharacterized protein (TIGR02611 family)
VVAIVGSAILLVGIAMMVLPGPAFIAIPLGLLVLATEFNWAQRLLERVRLLIEKTRARYREHRRKKPS